MITGYQIAYAHATENKFIASIYLYETNSADLTAIPIPPNFLFTWNEVLIPPNLSRASEICTFKTISRFENYNIMGSFLSADSTNTTFIVLPSTTINTPFNKPITPSIDNGSTLLYQFISGDTTFGTITIDTATTDVYSNIANLNGRIYPSAFDAALPGISLVTGEVDLETGVAELFFQPTELTGTIEYLSGYSDYDKLIYFYGTLYMDDDYTLGTEAPGEQLFIYVTGVDNETLGISASALDIVDFNAGDSYITFTPYRARWITTINDYISSYYVVGYDTTNNSDEPLKEALPAEPIYPLISGSNSYPDGDTILKIESSNTSNISAIFPLESNKIISLATPITGYSITASTFFITSNNTGASLPFTADIIVSPVFGEYIKTSAINTFFYDPPNTEVLEINVDQRTYNPTTSAYSEWLAVRRVVTAGDDTVGSRVYISAPLKPIEWITNNVELSTISGISVDINNPKYWLDVNAPFYGSTDNQIIKLLRYESLIPGTTTTIITGYDIVEGIDKIISVYSQTNTSDVFLTAKYLDQAEPIATHSFLSYFAPTQLTALVLDYDNDFFVRSLTATVKNNDNGVIGDIHPLIDIAWNVDIDQRNITAYDVNGIEIQQNQFISNSRLPVVFKFITSTFDNITTFAQLCTINVSATAKNTFEIPAIDIGTVSLTVTPDTYPAANLFKTSFSINEFSSLNNTSVSFPAQFPFTVTVTDTSTITNPVNNGSRQILKDGVLRTQSETLTDVVNSSGPNVYTLILSGVEVNGGIFPHTESVNVTASFANIDDFPIADFIVYPSTIWQGTNKITISQSNLSLVQGTSAYNVTNEEIFQLSAATVSTPDAVYNWFVNGVLLAEFTGPTASYQAVGILTGAQVKLKITTPSIPLTSPDTYFIDGVEYLMPNVKFTDPNDNTNPLFQHIRTYAFDIQTPVITSYTTDLLVTPSGWFIPSEGTPGLNTIYAGISLTPVPTNSPFQNTPVVTYWSLSSNNWLIPGNRFTRIGTSFAEKLRYGYVQNQIFIPYMLEGRNEQVTLTVHTVASVGLPDGVPVVQESSRVSRNINIVTAPEPYIVPDQAISVTGVNIKIINNTVKRNNVFDKFVLYTGEGNDSVTATPYEMFNVTYNNPGVYTATLHSYYNDGSVYIKSFPQYITILPKFDSYNPNIKRIYGKTILKLPYSFSDIRVPPNEFVTANTINSVFEKLSDNIIYIDNMLNFYNPPPTEYVGWFGSFNYNNNSVENIWKLVNGTSSQYYEPSAGVAGLFSNVNSIAKYDNRYYVTDNNELKIIFNNELVAKTDRTYVNRIFQSLKSVLVDSIGRIFVLDGLTVTVFDNYLQTNDWVVYNSWGTFGRTESKYGLYKPNSIVFDREGYIWVVSTGNKALKKYSKSGEWTENIDCTNIVPGDDITNNGMIDIAFDVNNNIHILTSDTIYIIDRSGNTLNTVDISEFKSFGTPKKMISQAREAAFIYVTYDNAIVKIKEDGIVSGVFGDDIGNIEYNGIFQDNDYGLYITNKYNIVKFTDILNIVDLSDNNAEKYYWNLENEINVKPGEYVQDWIYAKAFSKMYDNIDLFRRSIIGKPQYDYTSGKQTVKIIDLDIDEYQKAKPIAKSEIIFGINEYVSADVFNRSIKILVTNQEKILELIKDET